MEEIDMEERNRLNRYREFAMSAIRASGIDMKERSRLYLEERDGLNREDRDILRILRYS